MNKVARESSAPETKRWFREGEDWAALFVAPLMILGGFLHFAFYHSYDLLSPEILIAIGLLAGAGLIVGLLTVMIRGDLVRAAFLGLLLIVFCDIQFDQWQVAGLQFIGESMLLRVVVVAPIMFSAAFIVMALRKHLSTILATVFAVFLVMTIALPPEPVDFGPQPISTAAPAAKDLPPIVHLVLDGHIGVEGIPQDIEGGPELRQALVDFYLSHGFRLFGRAYSQHFLTRYALATLLNPGPPRFRDWLTGDSRWILHQNRYFDRLSDDGYLIRVYQTEYMNFCEGSTPNIEICYRYPAASLGLLSDMAIPVAGKSALLISAHLVKSSVYKAVMRLRDRLSNLGLFAPRNRHTQTFFSLGTLDVMHQVVADLTSAAKGRAYFVHLMLPHGPYVFLEDCQVRRDVGDWLDRRLEHHDFAAIGSADYREAAYTGYFAQTHCLITALAELFDTLKQAGVWDHATIILHGDHGSRITLRDPFETHLDSLSPQDILDSYSTFFAIRAPSIAPGYDLRTVSIQDLFAEQIFGLEPEADDAVVFSAPSGRYPMRRIEMVPIGPNNPASSTSGAD